MNANRQLINLAGILVVVALLVAGIALIAMPMYAQSRETDADTRAVDQTNAVYEAQITQLSAQNERIDEIDAALASLRTAIPPQTTLDDVFELIADAVERTDVTVSSIKVGDAEPWSPRSGIAEGEEATPAPAEPTPDDGESATGGEADAETDPAPSSPAPEVVEVNPQQQLLVTIEVEVSDADTAMEFVDLLGKGPRLVAPIDATLEDGILTASVLTFVRMEN